MIEISDFDGLPKLFEHLSAFGFRVTPRQRASAVLLCSLLVKQQADVPHPRFCNMLAAVLCTSREEQEQFAVIFAMSFPERQPPGVTDSNRPTTSHPEERHDEARHWESKLRRAQTRHQVRQTARSAGFWLAGLLFLVGVLRLALPNVLPGPSSQVSVAPLPTDSPEGSSVTVEPPHENGSPAPPLDERPQDDSAPIAEEPKPSPRPLAVSPQADSNSAWVYDQLAHGPLLTTVLLMLPMILIALVSGARRGLGSHSKRRFVLVPDSRIVQRLTMAANRLDVVSGAFFHAIQPMRRRIAVASTRIDIRRSVEASARSAGAPTLVASSQMVSPEYLVLIDRQSQDDFRGKISDKFLELSRAAGVHFTCYYFDEDPRRLYARSNSRAVDLDDLSPQHFPRLLILASPTGMMDMTTGQPAACASVFAKWRDPVLLTSKPQADWGGFEAALRDQYGFHVLPLSEAGFKGAARVFGADRTDRASIQTGVRAPLVEHPDDFDFEIGHWRWITGAEPTREEIRRLINHLRSTLSPQAFRWLQAMAVCPGIYWPLAQHLSTAVVDQESERTAKLDTLLELTRLPWIREGQMPAWLRCELVSEVIDPEFPDLRSVLAELFEVRPGDLIHRSALRSEGTDSVSLRSFLDNMDRVILDDALLWDFMTRSTAPGSDLTYRAEIAQLLGLRNRTSLWGRFLGRPERAALLENARELTAAIQVESPPRFVVRRQPSNDLHLWSHEVLEILPTRPDVPALNKTLYLCRSGPHDDGGRIVSEHALLALKRRKEILKRYAVGSFLTVLVASASMHLAYFESLPTVGMMCAWLVAILLIPFSALHLTILPPYQLLLRRFPVISHYLISEK